MGINSDISWTNHTFNPWWGCTFIDGDPACAPEEGKPGAICYAKTWAERTGYSESGLDKGKFPIWGAHENRRYFGDKHWNEPLKWNRMAGSAGVNARVFCMSMGDWAEGRPDQADYLVRLWDLILKTEHLNWMMLTKRPQLINKLCPLRSQRIWQGVTCVTQKWFDIRWEHLKRVDAEIYWLSVEPMMERIVLSPDFLRLGKRALVICGGQSGNNVVHINPDDARHLRDQCLDNGVRFHMKQMSGRTSAELEAIPEDLMIRQYPDSK